MFYFSNLHVNLKKLMRISIALAQMLIFTGMLLPVKSFAGLEINVITTPYYPPPAFVFVPQMQAYVAENSPFPVFYATGGYYLFRDNVWYIGPSYNGPWQYARVIPMQLRRFHAEQWHYWQEKAHEYHRRPNWNYFRPNIVEHRKPIEHNQYPNNHQHYQNNQYNNGYNNNDHYHQYR